MGPNALTLAALALSAAGLSMLISAPARACGGFFCNRTPVVQSGERIIFHVDHGAHTVQAIINITYQGQASDFAWLLPLPSAPRAMEVGSSYAFSVLESATAPRFQVQNERQGTCSARFGDAGSANADVGVQPGGVGVVSEAPVGPYDSVVLEGSDPDAIEAWLTSNGYLVTRAMMQLVIPYLMKGDVLVALKLKKDSLVGDIQPLSVTLAETEEPCIPVRLTAIAAQPNMDVTAFLLSSRGRAVPSNYLHMTPNPVRINWTNGGRNYRQLITEAKDEAGGHAFTTEYAGALRSMPLQIDTRFSIAVARAATNFGDFIFALQQLSNRPELGAILQRHVDEAELRARGIAAQSFGRCPLCFAFQLTTLAYDPTAAAEEIEARILVPDRAAQALLDRASYLTRLYTQLSPEDMTLDPTFEFVPNLPEVSNVRRARVVEKCDGRRSTFHVTLEDGTEYDTDASGNPLPANMNLPANIRIEDIQRGTVLRDNGPMIRERLAIPGPQRHAADHGCGCTAPASNASSAGAAGVAWIVALIALVPLKRSFARPRREARARRRAARNAPPPR